MHQNMRASHISRDSLCARGDMFASCAVKQCMWGAYREGRGTPEYRLCWQRCSRDQTSSGTRSPGRLLGCFSPREVIKSTHFLHKFTNPPDFTAVYVWVNNDRKGCFTALSLMLCQRKMILSIKQSDLLIV